MIFGKRRRIEVEGRLPDHADALYDGLRSAIGLRGPGQDPVEPDAFEGIARRGAPRLTRIAPAPCGPRQAPSGFRAGAHRVAGLGERTNPAEAEKDSVGAAFHRPDANSM